MVTSSRVGCSITIPAALILALPFSAAYAHQDVPLLQPEISKPVITLLENGAEPRQVLRFNPTPGDSDKQEMITRMSMEQSMGGMPLMSMSMPGIKVVMETVVEDVAANGDITHVTRFIGAEILEGPEVMPELRDQMAEAIAAIPNAESRSVSDSRGQVKSSETIFAEDVDPEVQLQMGSLTSTLDQVVFGLPEEAVGLGGSWKVEFTVSQEGFSLKQAVIWTVKSVDGGLVTFDIEISQNAETQKVVSPLLPPEASMTLLSMEGQGTGSAILDLARVVPQQLEMRMESRTLMSIDFFGETEEMLQKMNMEMLLRPAEDPGNGREALR